MLLLLLFVAASAPLTTRSAPAPPPLSEHTIRAPADVSILSAQWAHYEYRRNFRLGRRVNRPIGPARIGPFRAGGRAPMLICALGRADQAPARASALATRLGRAPEIDRQPSGAVVSEVRPAAAAPSLGRPKSDR